MPYFLQYQDDRVACNWIEYTYDEAIEVRQGVCKVGSRASADELRTSCGFSLISEEEYNNVVNNKEATVAVATNNSQDELHDDDFSRDSFADDIVADSRRRGRLKGSKDGASRRKRA